MEYPLDQDALVLFFLARSVDPITGEGDHVTGLTGAEPVISLSRGEEFAALDPQPVVTEIGRGWYAAVVLGAEITPSGELLFLATAADADDCVRVLTVGTTAAQLTTLTAAIAANTSALAANTSATSAATAAVAAMDGTLDDQVAVVAWIKAFTRGKKVRTQTHFRVYHPDIPPTPEAPDGTLIFECELKKADGGAPKAMPLTAAVTEEADTVNYA